MTDQILSKTASCDVQVICGKQWGEFSNTQVVGVKFCDDCSKSIILIRLQNEQNASEFTSTFENEVFGALAGKGISIYVQYEEQKPSPLRMKISKAKERALCLCQELSKGQQCWKIVLKRFTIQLEGGVSRF